MKKNSKKKPHNNKKYYTEGRNVFGDKAKTKLIVVKKETAFEQLVKAICQVDEYDSEIEYTFDLSCFNDSPNELNMIMNRVNAFMQFRASLSNKEYYDLRSA